MMKTCQIRDFTPSIFKRFEKVILERVLECKVIEICGIVRKSKKLSIERHLFWAYEPIDYALDGSVIHYAQDLSGYFNKGQFFNFN